MKKLTCFLVFVFCFLSVGQVMAADGLYLTPGVSYIFPDSDRLANSNFGYHLGIGKPVTQRFNLELTLISDHLSQKKDEWKFDQLGLGVDGLYFFPDHKLGSLTSYSLFGVGVMQTKFDGGRKATNLVANLGVGFFSQLSKIGLAIRSDIGLRLDETGIRGEGTPSPYGIERREFFDWVINATIVIPLEKKKAVVVAKVSAPIPVEIQEVIDTDGDGIPDNRDDCSNTPSGIKVNARGCEFDTDGDGVPDSRDLCPGTLFGVKVDARGCEPDKDSDGDGVVDPRDLCPGTHPGVKVDARGCDLEKDTDDDGIPDSHDICPGTRLGAKVNVFGCELPTINKPAEAIILRGVEFQEGSSLLLQESLIILNSVADTLIANSGLIVEVAGHTNNNGSDRFNMRLSKKRANSVMEYLFSRGVSTLNLTAVGYGFHKPIPDVDKNTTIGKIKNRRVELHILSGGQ